MTGQTVSVPDPQYTFEVSYDSPSCAKFEALRNGRDLMYAYHGSRLENFHSILHFGLQGHLSKVSEHFYRFMDVLVIMMKSYATEFEELLHGKNQYYQTAMCLWHISV